MASRKMIAPTSFESVYKRLEEVVLANSGENEFEEIFKLIIVKLWDDSNDFCNRSYTIAEMNERLSWIDKAWPGVLIDIHSKITEEQLQTCMQILSNVNLTDGGYESIDGIFEYLISREKKGSKGQYFTPRYFVDFCVNIINPQRDEIIADPAAGSGAFLYHAFNHNSQILASNLWGFDFDNNAVRISKLLMYVGNVKDCHVHKVNSLLKDEARNKMIGTSAENNMTTIEDIMRLGKEKAKFDVIMTNPPFAGEVNDIEMLNCFEVATGKNKIERDVLFIERCIELLNPGGRMSIVLPDNIFGSKENEGLRRWIMDRCRIVGVIGIPRNAFMPHTSVKTSILFLQKRINRRTINEENIFFGISEKPGKDSRGKICYKSKDDSSLGNVDHDLDLIQQAFKDFIYDEKIGW